ncbi:MAG: hypothetical protein HC781_03090 [Leptolyngbyaceae cyanobacterium CSU_1_4]|nr:hypothetical protein [Leptolyngbyaceae cyanobacterium CSU_1_4]
MSGEKSLFEVASVPDDLNASTLNLDTFALNNDAFSTREDVSLPYQSEASAIAQNKTSNSPESLASYAAPDVLQLKEEPAETEDVSLIHPSATSAIAHPEAASLPERFVGSAAPDILQLREEKTESLDLSSKDSLPTLAPENFSPSSESSSPDWSFSKVATPSSPEIQRQVENVSFTNILGVTPTEERISPQKIQLESADTTVQQQSNAIGDRATDTTVQRQNNAIGDRADVSPASTNPGSLAPIEPQVFPHDASVYELSVQRHLAIENTQFTTAQNSNLIRQESDSRTLPDLQNNETETNIGTVLSGLTEQETRSLNLFLISRL